MPDAFGRLTPEEERMLRAKMSPNMINQSAQPTSEAYALADQDFTGREAALAQQMRMGQEGMMAPLAKGKQAGDVYVGPTWSEGLDTAFQRAMGGYQMGQAMKGRKGLQQARDDQSQARGVIGKSEREQAAGQQATENENATTRLNQSASQIANTASREEARIAEAAAAIERDDAYRKEQQAAKIEAARLLQEGKRDLAGGKKGKKTAAQNTAAYRADTFEQGLEDMTEVMEIYDPTSWEGLKDKYANKSDFTRWASSTEGEQFQSAANTVKEAALRTATGAAAPQGENAEYIVTLIPQPFEKQETVKFKMKKLGEFRDNLKKLGGDTPEEEAANYNIAAAQIKEEMEGEVTSQAQFDALPSGASYYEDGVEYRKP
jgi:hypothetical protein